jgi:hypothetical protein
VTAPWWTGLPAVEVDGPQEADGHRLRWTGGELALLAHDDPEAERALGALGGERCACLDVLDAWQATHDDGAILTVGSRSAGDPITGVGPAVESLRADLRRWRATSGSLVEEARLSRDTHAIDRLVAVAGPAEAAAARRLGFLLLLDLDPALLHRLQASVAAAFADRPERAPQLTVATAARAADALRAAGWRGALADVRLGEAEVSEVTEESAVLPSTWLAEVWGRGLAGAVPGHLVVEVTAVTPDGGAEVVALAAGKSRMALRVAPVGE